ncbi:hypothetical protein E2C01_031104 [Portunus trituberculatus]|uniref:Uncharacterized protein n=1 Tax=Portunus trituberculatus TaxID=210409 RepID=A0A5B7EWS0_PORTR|nr:hypothetical protein [Portunus trituberculatus]
MIEALAPEGCVPVWRQDMIYRQCPGGIAAGGSVLRQTEESWRVTKKSNNSQKFVLSHDFVDCNPKFKDMVKSTKINTTEIGSFQVAAMKARLYRLMADFTVPKSKDQ